MASKFKSKTNAIIFIIVLLGLGFWIPSKFSFTRTKSLDHRLFFVTSFSVNDRLNAGDYVMFESNNPLIADLIRETGTNKLIKRVICSEGSSLKVDGLDFFCDGQKIGRALEKTPSGVQIGHFQFKGVIPAGNYFVMGTTLESFDSRYFGFVEKKSILSIAYPII